MTETPEPSTAPRSRGWAKLGIVLILVSGVLWFSIFAVPFLPLRVGVRTAIAGALFVGAQIAWWSGAALAGPETVRRIRGWFSRRKPPVSNERDGIRSGKGDR